MTSYILKWESFELFFYCSAAYDLCFRIPLTINPREKITVKLPANSKILMAIFCRQRFREISRAVDITFYCLNWMQSIPLTLKSNFVLS